MFTTTMFGVIGDDYYAHQVVKSIFPNKVLFQKRDSMVIAISEELPLKECFDKKVKIGKTKEVVTDFEEGMELQFSLKVNPTKRVNGKRVGVEENEIKDWLHRKLNESTELVVTDIQNDGIVGSKNGEFFHLSVLVTGIMKIKSVEKIKYILKNGLGSSKGLGYGMLYFF